MIELSAAALFLLSTFYGGVPADTALEAKAAPVSMFEAKVHDQPITLEAYVREYFKDTPVMAEIAKCESRFRHVGKSGKIIRGEVTSEDVGVMQVNEYFHEKTATVLGFDLHALDGNLAYAKWLYAKEGIKPWFSSSKCWQKSNTPARTNFPENSHGLARADVKPSAN